VIVSKNILMLYPGYGGEVYIGLPITEPRPVPLYGIVRPLYGVPLKWNWTRTCGLNDKISSKKPKI